MEGPGRGPAGLLQLRLQREDVDGMTEEVRCFFDEYALKYVVFAFAAIL